MISLLKGEEHNDLSGGQVMVTTVIKSECSQMYITLVNLAVSVTMTGLDVIYIEAYIWCKYVLTEVWISPAAHTVSPHLIHPLPSPGPYGSFLLVLFTFLQYKITSDRGWHSSPRLPPCLFHEWAWKELLYQRCGQRTPPVGIQAISPVTQPTYHQPNDILIPRISAQQEPLLPTYRLETKHFYCQGKKVLNSWVSPAQFLKWSQRGF